MTKENSCITINSFADFVLRNNEKDIAPFANGLKALVQVESLWLEYLKTIDLTESIKEQLFKATKID